MAEGARLESVYTGNRIVGSNPTLSATQSGPQSCLCSSDCGQACQQELRGEHNLRQAFGEQGRSVKKVLKRYMRCLMNIWPPFLGAGIRVKRLQSDWKEIDVEMRLRRWNSNYVGTHYGGSLYSMVDPFYMLMLIENLGRDYIVWDKSASIRFRQPGKGVVSAAFRLSDEQVAEIREALKSQQKIDRVFTVEVKDESGVVIAEVQKQLHIRRKSANPS